MKYLCPCGYEYDPAVGDPDNGIAPGTAWEDLPEDWVCPVCGLGKDACSERRWEAAQPLPIFFQNRFIGSGGKARPVRARNRGDAVFVYWQVI